MSRPRRVRLDDCCTLGEKLNNATLADGSDLYKCIYCGKRHKQWQLERTNRVYGPCLVSPARRDTILAEREMAKAAKRVDPSAERTGHWHILRKGETPESFDAGNCYSCGAANEIVPRQGHPNSRFWVHERANEVLVACTNPECITED